MLLGLSYLDLLILSLPIVVFSIFLGTQPRVELDRYVSLMVEIIERYLSGIGCYGMHVGHNQIGRLLVAQPGGKLL